MQRKALLKQFGELIAGPVANENHAFGIGLSAQRIDIFGRAFATRVLSIPRFC